MIQDLIPVNHKETAMSSILIFFFRLAWIGRIPIPLSIAVLELLLNLRIQLNINIDFV